MLGLDRSEIMRMKAELLEALTRSRDLLEKNQRARQAYREM
jgi:hypothetical protein